MSIDVRPPTGIWHPGYISGRWYNSSQGATTTAILTGNLIYYVPIKIYRPVTIGSIGHRITTSASASAKYRLGLYSDGGGVPSTLIGSVTAEQAGDAAPNSYGFALAASVSVGPGIVWGAVFTDGAGTQMTVAVNNISGANTDVMGGSIISSALSAASVGYSQSLTYTTLPSTVGTLAQVSSTCPLMAFAVA